MSRRVFNSIAGIRPGRSVHDLSYQKLFTCDMGQLIPIMCEEVVPGDKFQIGNQIVLRFQPLINPILHEIFAYTHYYFVPYRLLWDKWEEFITGGVDGEFAEEPPKWFAQNNPGGNQLSSGTLWDYLGFPTDVRPDGAEPLDFPRRAYNFIWNEYYRDQNLMEEVELDNWKILLRTWRPKGYFTTALPWQQRGIAPALPIQGMLSANFLGADFWKEVQTGFPAGTRSLFLEGGQTSPFVQNINQQAFYQDARMQFDQQVRDWLGQNEVNMQDAVTFNAHDLRLVFQLTKWMERNARAGARYTEFLRAHFGVSPRDDRLDRPEYIGGSRSPVIISEVLQTSESGISPQGNMAGHGITVDGNRIASYTAQEFGLIMGIMSVMPMSAYQQGINRQWLRRTRYDFYFPEFAQLSEQAIEQAEIFVQEDVDENKQIWGYTGRYNEMRYKENMVCGLMRDDFAHWHLGRIFDDPPALNEEFLLCNPESTKRVFAVQNEPGLIVNFGNRIRAIRPIPFDNNPGLIDHF